MYQHVKLKLQRISSILSLNQKLKHMSHLENEYDVIVWCTYLLKTFLNKMLKCIITRDNNPQWGVI